MQISNTNFSLAKSMSVIYYWYISGGGYHVTHGKDIHERQKSGNSPAC